jgi:predicted site-specific integrase-resolvase
MPDRHLTIGELAKRTGVATSALRYYEEFGLIPAPARTSGQRRYPEDIATCPNFASVITARLAGKPLQEAHRH